MSTPRCDFRYDHNLNTDTPCGPRCEATATHRIDWEDGRHSFGCAKHIEIDEAATVKPKRITPLLDESLKNTQYRLVRVYDKHVLCSDGDWRPKDQLSFATGHGAKLYKTKGGASGAASSLPFNTEIEEV